MLLNLCFLDIRAVRLFIYRRVGSLHKAAIVQLERPSRLYPFARGTILYQSEQGQAIRYKYRAIVSLHLQCNKFEQHELQVFHLSSSKVARHLILLSLTICKQTHQPFL